MQHLAVLISQGFRHVFSNPQSTTNSAIPKMHTPCNPNPCKTPKPAAFAVGSCKKQKLCSSCHCGITRTGAGSATASPCRAEIPARTSALGARRG